MYRAPNPILINQPIKIFFIVKSERTPNLRIKNENSMNKNMNIKTLMNQQK